MLDMPAGLEWHTTVLHRFSRPGLRFPMGKQVSMPNQAPSCKIHVLHKPKAATSHYIFCSVVVVGKLIAFELALVAQPYPNSFRHRQARRQGEGSRETTTKTDTYYFLIHMYKYMYKSFTALRPCLSDAQTPKQPFNPTSGPFATGFPLRPDLEQAALAASLRSQLSHPPINGI